MLQRGRPGWHWLSESIARERSEIKETTVCGLSHFNCDQLLVTLWTVAHQAPLSMGFPRQECWSGLPCPPVGDLPDPGIKPKSLTSPALTDGFFAASTTWETQTERWRIKNGAWQGSADGAPEPGMNEPFPAGTPLRRKQTFGNVCGKRTLPMLGGGNLRVPSSPIILWQGPMRKKTWGLCSKSIETF